MLVVDDEPLTRWPLAETLLDSGHLVREAADGATAVRALTDAEDPIDVVLLDYRLPGSNDLSLLSTIRHLAPKAAVIMMTAYSSATVSDGALELGAYQVVAKAVRTVPDGGSRAGSACVRREPGPSVRKWLMADG